jgi:glyceraldehyde-3-phosphate dehydrogenase/erythrose-4-phosphate dehydrogenase
VRFGTDGKRFATIAWNEGGILVVMEASSASRKPEELKNHLTSLASEIVQ